jgi:Dot/Icm secretion system protein IcmQ
MAEYKESAIVELGEKLAKILDKLLETGDWDTSLFLRSSSKRLRQLRDEALRIATKTDTGTNVAKTSYRKAPSSGYVQVYVSIYQVNCKNLQDWQNALKALVEHSASRPTYLDEDNVRQLIRSKTDIDKHGYVIINVKDSEIYSTGQIVLDNFGSRLVTLKDGAIKLENIVGFVHGNREQYSFQNNALIYEGEV